MQRWRDLDNTDEQSFESDDPSVGREDWIEEGGRAPWRDEHEDDVILRSGLDGVRAEPIHDSFTWEDDLLLLLASSITTREQVCENGRRSGGVVARAVAGGGGRWPR